MAACRITCVDGGTIDVQGDLQAVVEELHKVFTRRATIVTAAEALAALS